MADDASHEHHHKHKHHGDMDPNSAEFQQALKQRQLDVYKRLMRRAGMGKATKKHMHHFVNMDESEKLSKKMGSVSNDLYDEIYGARKFDRYGRMLSTKMSSKEQMLSNLAQTLQAQMVTGEEAEARPQLKTSIYDVGYKAQTFGPPGLRQPMAKVLNSEGNEKFFAYDGTWRNGEMNGRGFYEYADGMRYRGDFREGVPQGQGVAEYPGDARYEGQWDEGKYSGRGCLEYSGGVT
jgi:hypothetical protein